MGRPSFQPTEEHRNTVTVMIAGGLVLGAIAGALGISIRTLQKHFRKEIANGFSQVNALVISAHIKRIRAGDMRAIEWWQKARMGWREHVVLDDSRLADTPMRVVVELVGEAGPLTIEHDRPPRQDIDPSYVEYVG